MLTIKFVRCRGHNAALDYELSPSDDLTAAIRDARYQLESAKYRERASGFQIIRHDLTKEGNAGAIIHEWYVGDP
jgi:hypothetical protein